MGIVMQDDIHGSFSTGGDPCRQAKIHATGVVERVEKRLLDLGELRAAVQDRLVVLNVREGETTRRLHTETVQLLQQIRLREEELLSMVQDDCRLQREQLQQVLERIEAMERQLVSEKGRMEGREWDAAERERARCHLMDVLRDSAFFYVPDPCHYVLTTQKIPAERHLTLVRDPSPSFLPSALTVPITDAVVHLPHRAADASLVANAAPSMVVQNGIFHYIATAGGTKPFYNPVESDAIRASCSAPIVLGDLSVLFENVDVTKTPITETEMAAVLQQQQHCFRTASHEMGRIEIDFGDRRWVECSAYALRHGHVSEHAALRSWRLLGSRDRAHWILLDERHRDGVLGSAPFNVAVFTVDERRVLSRARNIYSSPLTPRCAFRYIALELTGPDAVGEYHMELSGLELYGNLLSPGADVASVSAYNEMSVANRVVRACAWTDNSADFVFGDGTVLSFCDEMQTFVAIDAVTTTASRLHGHAQKACNGEDSRNNNNNSNGHTNTDTEGDYYFTSLTLSKYEGKVKEALQIYNYYSPQPRIIAGLMATPCEVWRLHSPIDSLVIAADRRLFERNGAQATLWCALRRISLTLHGNRITFSVRWPARAVERNGARSIFVRPFDKHGCVTGTLESLQSFHYVWVDQTFPVLCPPAEWVEMLQIALQLDAEVPAKGAAMADGGAPQLDEGECHMMYGTTPRTAQDRQPCRFSRIKREHVHSLIATSQMQNATCNRLIRNSCERVVWRYDADPLGRVPHAVYWCLHTCNVDATARLPFCGNSSVSGSNEGMSGLRVSRCATGSVLAMVREDESSLLAEPQGHGYVVHHWRRDGTYKQYHQSADGSLGLPPVISIQQNGGTQDDDDDDDDDGGDNRGYISSDGTTPAAEESLPLSSMMPAEGTDGIVSSSRLTTSSLYFGGNLEEAPFSALHRGRYLPDVGASCIQLSQLNLASLRAQQQEALGGIATVTPGVQAIGIPGLHGADMCLGDTADALSSLSTTAAAAAAAAAVSSSSSSAVMDRTQMRLVSNDPALALAAADGNVVYLTSTIDGVGNFSALTNGTIRCHFNDRTILFVIPGADDREESLIATCLFRDATQCSMRLVKCLPHHPMYRYVAYALQFRRFARLSPDDRTAVVKDTAEMKVELLKDSEWRRASEVEHELHELLSRTKALLSGNDELSRENQAFLRGDKTDRSAYFP